MAMTPERKKVKQKVTKQLKSLGAYFTTPATWGYGKSGVSDFLGCYCGKFFAFECKANGGKLTPLQEFNLQQVREADGLGMEINEGNVEHVTEILLKLGNK